MKTTIQDICAAGPVIPVIEISDASSARPLAEALIKGGINVMEVTLRTPEALSAIEAAAGIPDFHVGAGTLLSASDVGRAVRAGASFGVSPGSNIEILEACSQSNLPFLPGASTPSEMINLMEHGHYIQKFFPAEAAGGIQMLKAVSGPFKDLKFCPTGGVSPGNVTEYLGLSNVICVGGSWIASRKLVAEKAWDTITENARHASSLLT